MIFTPCNITPVHSCTVEDPSKRNSIASLAVSMPPIPLIDTPLGNESATVLNLQVLEILPDDNAIVVSGAVPGADGTVVVVCHAAKERRRHQQVGVEAGMQGAQLANQRRHGDRVLHQPS